ncbi:MAG: acetate--CoA ligase family protein [Anaerolineae bacterium]
MSPFSSPAQDLMPFFRPRGVAVVGASRNPAKLSYAVLRNLATGAHRFPGPVYPINPQANEILGLPCYPSLAAAPDPLDLAVLVIPAAAVLAAVEACGQRGIKAIVLISGGFRETGPQGAAHEEDVVALARRYGMRLVGPNGIGIMDTHTPLNTTFVKDMPPSGHIAFLSQSGALCGGIIDWAIRRGIAFSRLLSIGNQADVSETEWLSFLAADDNSQVIALYLEDIKGGPAFVHALRAAAAVKPVLALKAGRTASGQAATASHTGALAGAHVAFHAACLQTGVIEAPTIQALFHGALALTYQPLPAGNRFAILTNAGGPAALAADELEAAGLHLARTGPAAQLALRQAVGPEAQVAGPVDLLGGADAADYRRALEVMLADPDCDGVLVILVPQALVDAVAVVEAIAASAAAQPGKPLLACLMGAASLDAANRAAHAAHIPAYVFPDQTVSAAGVLWQRAAWLARPPATQFTGLRVVTADEAALRRLAFQAATAGGQQVLDAAASEALLAAYGLAVAATGLATTTDEAAQMAQAIGFPVALKLISPDILHKTDVGGVLLDVRDADAARAGFEAIIARARASQPRAHVRGVLIQKMLIGGQEVIIGVQRDPTFGPLVMFGLGGIYVEALADVSFRLAPLTQQDAEEMIAEVRGARLLDGLRGQPPADRAALVDALLRVGQMAVDHPQISELDINPLLVMPAGQGAIAVDARIILA